jgi:hypothetical protein
MERLRDRPLPAEIYDSARDFNPETQSVYLYGISPEDRFGHINQWSGRSKDVFFLQIPEQTSSNFSYVEKGETKTVALRSDRQLSAFWHYATSRNCEAVYLDVTGFAHHVWAPLLRSGLQHLRNLNVVYAEPSKYRVSVAPTEGEIFDLSERIQGIAPLPGFASLATRSDDTTCFVPLLGFEGIRLAHLIEQVQPPVSKIVPIIGVPGFRIEFPFFSYQGNRLPLSDTSAWKNVRYCAANDPFSLFYVLEDIAKDHPSDTLQIALIGTKPHSIGAVIYALSRPNAVEIIYDHPVRKAERTEGTARLLVFHVSTFLRS